MALDECFSEKWMLSSSEFGIVFINKVAKAEDSLQEYPKILVQKISQKNSYLEKIIHDFYSTQNSSTIWRVCISTQKRNKSFYASTRT